MNDDLIPAGDAAENSVADHTDAPHSTLHSPLSAPAQPAQPKIREQHYLCPKTGERKPLKMKILRGGKRSSRL